MDNNNPPNPSNPVTTPQNTAVNYKHRAIKVYSSDEWMADATKKYRRVFDRYETTFMRAEFSFFNKLFDENDWEASVRLKCFFLNGTQKNELCNLESKRKVLKDENIVYVRQSWGTEIAGSYWFRGDYLWEAYIDEVKVGEAKFHVEDLGPSKGENLFFDIDSIKLFEGNGQAYLEQDKKYLTTFKQAETRNVWAEFKLKSKTAKDYYAEIFFNFYNDAGQLKGSHDYMQFIPANSQGQIFTLFPGWGGETPGRWSKDTYTLEVVFMDQLLAVVPFEVADAVVEGTPVVHTDNASVFKSEKATSNANATSTTEKTGDALLQEALGELNALTGLTQIKNEVNEMVQLVKFYQETGKDVLSRFSLHTVFTGNPGTGKTTVARILSRIYKGLGILQKGHLVEVDREGLVAGFIGQTAIKTAEKVTESMGGVLFIDEAYSLAGKSYNDFGSEAIQVILKRMEDNRGKFGVIVAGYTGNMIEFIESNPGLKSRFDKYFEFPDYAPNEMFHIAEVMFKREEVQLDEAARNHVYNYFTFIYERRDQHFGNARAVRQVVGECIKNQHLRLAAMKKEERTPEVMSLVIFDDVKEFEMKENTTRVSQQIGFRTGAKG
jgi:AAA+ superfamily predicted ATPase